MSQHRGYVNTKKIEKATGYHFDQKNHSLADMKFSIIDKNYNKNRYYLLDKEKLLFAILKKIVLLIFILVQKHL